LFRKEKRKKEKSHFFRASITRLVSERKEKKVTVRESQFLKHLSLSIYVFYLSPALFQEKKREKQSQLSTN